MAYTFRQVGRHVELQLREDRDEQVRRNKPHYELQAIGFVLCGILAAAMPGVTAMGLELFLGTALLTSGFFQLILAREAGMQRYSLVSAVVALAIGAIMLLHPILGLVALMTLVTIFLAIEGMMEIVLALQFKAGAAWGWMLFSGAIALGLAALLWIGFPTLDVLYLGWVVAINFVLYGFSLWMLSRRAHA